MSKYWIKTFKTLLIYTYKQINNMHSISLLALKTADLLKLIKTLALTKQIDDFPMSIIFSPTLRSSTKVFSPS